MRKMGKKLMALAMAGVMMCAPMTVFAADTTESPAEGSTSGSGEVEGWVGKDVFNVVLPTVADNDSTFNFILDPQGLITETNQAAYSGSTFTGDGLYFKNKDGNYSASSDELKAINKSTMDVNVTLTASVDTNLKLTTDKAFTDDTTNSIYLALVSGSDEEAITSDAVAQIDTSIDALENAYKVDYADGQYKYVIDTNVAADDNAFNSVSFKLTGACNQTDGVDWSSYVDEAPTVDVTWTLSDPNGTKTPESDGSTPIVITFTGEAPAAGSLTFTKPDGTTWTPGAALYGSKILLDSDTKTITLTAAWLAPFKTTTGFGAGTYKVTINGTDYSYIIK